MRTSAAIKPISYIKTRASEIIRELNHNHETIIITRHGETKVIIQDIKLSKPQAVKTKGL